MNPFLSALTPRRTVTFGAGKLSVSAAALAPSLDQPLRLYRVFSRGGGIFTNAELAQLAAKSDYVVTTFKPTADERAYLQGKGIAVDKPMWMIYCDGREQKDATGAWRCAPLSGLTRMSEKEIRDLNLVSKRDYDAAFRFISPGAVAGYRYFSAEKKLTADEEAVALQLAHRWNKLAESVAFMQKTITVSGLAFSGRVTRPLENALVFLAETAQPFLLFQANHPEAFPGAGTQISSASSVFGVTPIHAAAGVAVVAVVLAGAAVFVYNCQVELSKQEAAIDEAYRSMQEELVDCVTNPETSHPQRVLCRQTMGELTKQKPEMASDPGQTLVDALKYMVPILGIGAAVVYLGPAVKVTSETAASKWRRVTPIEQE